MNCKPLFLLVLFVLSAASLSACSTNPATGKQQFAALMPPAQEAQVGASEHQKIVKQFGLYEDAALQDYVNRVGRSVTADTERPDVQYKFFILDSPIVNAFALPGGYIYVSRGLLALANSEAELAAVLAHETGHITGRHSAERYSRGVVTSLGAAVLAAAVDSDGLTQALGVGSNLYLSSYSRGQENEADTLGLRYMTRAGYDAAQMAAFLDSLRAQTELDSRLAGNGGASGFSYFSTHPATADRVAKTRAEAVGYSSGGRISRDPHLSAVDGMIYGDSAKQGFVRGRSFYHPVIGFGFDAPENFTLVNQPEQVIATSPQSGSAILFDMVGSGGASDPAAFLTQKWLNGKAAGPVERIDINGMQAAATSMPGQLNNRPMTVQLIAIAWDAQTIARFQIAIPQGAPAGLVDSLKRTTYSFRRLSATERAAIKPYHVRIVTARSGDTPSTLAAWQAFDRSSEDRFRVLNGLRGGEGVQAGTRYKIIVE